MNTSTDRSVVKFLAQYWAVIAWLIVGVIGIVSELAWLISFTSPILMQQFGGLIGPFYLIYPLGIIVSILKLRRLPYLTPQFMGSRWYNSMHQASVFAWAARIILSGFAYPFREALTQGSFLAQAYPEWQRGSILPAHPMSWT